MTKAERQESRLDTLSDELQFLMKLKESIGKLNNRIHDKLAYIAIEKLKGPNPGIDDFKYGGAGVGGVDIKGYADGTLKLVAEVKATHTTEKVKLRGPQKSQIRKDLQRLAAVNEGQSPIMERCQGAA